MRMSHETWTRLVARLRAAGHMVAVYERGADGADAEVRATVSEGTAEALATEAGTMAAELVGLVRDAPGGALLTVSPHVGCVHVALTLLGAPPAGESEAQRALRLARQRLAEAGMADAVRVVEGVVA